MRDCGIKARIHADRTAGGDRDHRRPDRPLAARRPGGPRGGAAGAMRQQPEADRPGHRQLRVGHRLHRLGIHQLLQQRQLHSAAAATLPHSRGAGLQPGPADAATTGRVGAGWPCSCPTPSRRRSTTRSTSTCPPGWRTTARWSIDSDQRLQLPVGEQPDADVPDGRRQPEPVAGGQPVLRPLRLRSTTSAGTTRACRRSRSTTTTR